MKFCILRFNKIKSTQFTSKKIVNLLSKENLDIKYPLAIVAKEQTGSYGRFKRKWYSPKNGLWFSIVFRNRKISIQNVNKLIPLTAKIIQKSIKKVCNIKSEIKLPNDIIYNNRKIAGCLIETVTINKNLWIIIGIGINVNNTIPKKLNKTAISLKTIINKSVNTEKLFKNILRYYLNI